MESPGIPDNGIAREISPESSFQNKARFDFDIDIIVVSQAQIALAELKQSLYFFRNDNHFVYGY